MAKKTRAAAATGGRAVAKSAKTSKLIVHSAPWKDRLLERINELNTNPRKVSIKARLNPTTVNSLLKSARSPKIETAMAVADALGVSIQWLMTGEEIVRVGEGKDAPNDDLQKVPVLEWGSILDYIDHRDAEIMRYELAERIEPGAARFRVEFSGSSMSPQVNDGEILDCSGAILAEPEDVVVAYSKGTNQVVARQVIPDNYSAEGIILSGRLVSPNPAWPDLPFDTRKGDRIVAVVIDVIRPLKKVRRAGSRVRI